MFEHEDVVGVERGGEGRHLDSLGVGRLGPLHLEEPHGGLGGRVPLPRAAALQGQSGSESQGGSSGEGGNQGVRSGSVPYMINVG